MKKILLLLIFIFLIPIVIGNEGFRILSTNNTILNFTEHRIEESMSKALFHLGIEGLVISIHDVPNDLLYLGNNLTVNGFVIKDEDYECNYYLFLSPLLKSEKTIEVLAHELIHINQYYTKKLISINTEKVYWKDSLIEINKLKYIDRPWEKEAFDSQFCLYEIIK
jgi:hypothetical protein